MSWGDLNRAASDVEASMLDYELVILDKDAHPTAYVEMQESDDDDAIRSGANIADGRPFEIWHDIVCIHRSEPRPGAHSYPV